MFVVKAGVLSALRQMNSVLARLNRLLFFCLYVGIWGPIVHVFTMLVLLGVFRQLLSF